MLDICGKLDQFKLFNKAAYSYEKVSRFFHTNLFDELYIRQSLEEAEKRKLPVLSESLAKSFVHTRRIKLLLKLTALFENVRFLWRIHHGFKQFLLRNSISR
jgi:hypothetical protein